MTPEQRARLPRYAEEALRDLEHRLGKAEAVAAEISSHDAGAWTGRYEATPKPVAAVGEWVRFSANGVSGHRDWIDVKVGEDGALEVMGGDSLAVRPQVSNVVRIEVGR